MTRSEPPQEPTGNRLVERVAPVPRSTPRPIPNPDPAPPPAVEEPAAARPTAPAGEPIDRLSAFEANEKVGGEVAESSVAFGRHRRPFTARRKARQVKPPETKNLQALGGNDSEPSTAPFVPEPPAKPDRPQAPFGGRARMPNGIGPVEFDASDEEDDL